MLSFGLEDNPAPANRLTLNRAEIHSASLSMTLTIQGEDSANPNGDGSGVIIVSAKAENAVKDVFKSGDGNEVETVSVQATLQKCSW